MTFSVSPLFFLPFLAAGLWLSYKLYFTASIPRRWRWILGTLTLLAWFLLAGILTQPLWNNARTVYHPPVVVLALDESPSYAGGATVHSESAVQAGADQVRKFYQAQGFRVEDFIFGEKVYPAASQQSVGTLTSLERLRHHFDSLGLPNLQGVFVWTDGRPNIDGEARQNNWPAPVFPVFVPGGNSGEVQGEKVEVDFSHPDSSTYVNVEWRPVGTPARGATVELLSGGRSVWKGNLPASEAIPNSVNVVRHRFHLPASVLPRGEGKWLAFVRPERKVDNGTEKNDTIPVRLLGLRRNVEVFVRPLRSLEERGLVDALFASDSMEARVVMPGSLEENLRGAVLWTRSLTGAEVAAAKKSGAPALHYHLPVDAFTAKTAAFTSAARVTWREDVSRFLPGEVLSLADLGMSNVALPLAESSLEAVAWAEEGNRRGVLLYRSRASAPGIFEFIAPPVWSSGFSPAGEDRVRKLQERWVQGAGEWARSQNRRAPDSAKAVSTVDPLSLEMSRLGVDGEKLSALALTSKGSLLQTTETGTFRSALPDLPKGQSEESVSNSRAVFPMLTFAWIVAALLCLAWVARKKLHLD